MKFTGERYVPTEQGEIRLEHYHRYVIALDGIAGKDVLDLACGEGYGSFLMAKVAGKVTGVDVSAKAIRHANSSYAKRAKNLKFQKGNAIDLDLPDAAFDVVVSFETIEHLAEQSKMLAEIRRVLRPDGVLIISSPNRPIYSDVGRYQNEFHVKELDFNELDALLRVHFAAVRYFGQRLIIGSAMMPIYEQSAHLRVFGDNGEQFNPWSGRLVDPVYFLAVCGASESCLPNLHSSILLPESHDLLKKYLGYAKSITEPDGRISSLTQTVAERDGQIEAYRLQAEEFDRQLRAANTQIAGLNQTVAERGGQLVEFKQVVADRDVRIGDFEKVVAARDGQIANLNQVMAEHDGQIASLNQVMAERDGHIEAYRLQADEFDRQLRAASTQIAALNQAVTERDGQIAEFKQVVAERDGQIDSYRLQYRLQAEQFDGKLRAASTQIAVLNQAVTERDGKIAKHNQVMAERDGQIASPNQVVAERDGQIEAYRLQAEQFDRQLRAASTQIAGLNQAVTERDGQIASLNQVVAEREGQIASLKQTLPVKRADSAGTQDLHELPNDFDGALYLKLNPDVAEAGFDAPSHYLRHGRRENRDYLLPELCADHDLKADRETILVVSHEATRTGAPMLSLNLITIFLGRFNVVALFLGDGPLSAAVRLAGAVVMTSSKRRQSPIVANLLVGQLCERFDFKFALVNSMESCGVLRTLADYFVPTISLIHEFASYTRPRDAFRYAFIWSGEVVFSANVVLENALAEYPDLGDRPAHVLPQGRCLLPWGEDSEEQLEAERERIRRLIRPKNIAANAVIVLGAGYVQLRKGVDLFIECAARVVSAPDGDRCRFVWIGRGYDPDKDVGYSAYLADQIRRAGLQERVIFIDETPAIQTAYEEADMLVLSSRLDPLPNVAIDAMARGLPVLCFNRTTGIADFLIDRGLQNHCVAEYLDTAEMAKNILALAGSRVLREQVADRCRESSIAYFNMQEYAARLEVLARGACDRAQQEKADTQVILSSGLFRPDFSCPPQVQNPPLEKEARVNVRAYVRAWASGISRRKPFPGFHPGVYSEQHGVAVPGADPFADYIRAGRPAGPWSYPVMVAGEAAGKDIPDSQRVALHIHAYYPELLSEIISRLSQNRICPDLFVSTTKKQASNHVLGQLKDYKGKVVEFQFVPNRGRDIGPFLTAFGQRILANYDYVGHIHTKKSIDLKDAAFTQMWYRFLLENLLGGESGSMADSILARMEDDTSIGLVFPDDPYVVGWNANRAVAEPLAARMGLEKLPEHFIFPVGMMFWAKTLALAPLMNLKLDWDDYPEEPLPYDGTLLHAIERLFPLTLSIGNLRSATTNVIGLTR